MILHAPFVLVCVEEAVVINLEVIMFFNNTD